MSSQEKSQKPVPLISIIATTGRQSLFDITLPSLELCKKPENYHGLIIAYNGDETSWGATLPSYAYSISVLHTKHTYNKSAALNEALESLNDRFLVHFADDDIRFHEELLLAYARAGKDSSWNGFYGGPLTPEFETEPESELLAHILPYTHYSLPHDSLSTIANKQQHFLGANWAGFSDDILAAGGFNTRLGPATTQLSGEETELQSKLFDVLPGFYVPHALCWHYMPSQFLTPSWVMARRYQTGYYYGSISNSFGRVLIILILLFRNALSVVFYSLFKNKKGYYRHLFSLYEKCGYLLASAKKFLFP